MKFARAKLDLKEKHYKVGRSATIAAMTDFWCDDIGIDIVNAILQNDFVIPLFTLPCEKLKKVLLYL